MARKVGMVSALATVSIEQSTFVLMPTDFRMYVGPTLAHELDDIHIAVIDYTPGVCLVFLP